MSDSNERVLAVSDLTPPKYLLAVRDYLRTHEPEMWSWFASGEARAEYVKATRLDLLKSTYRLDEAAHPEVHHEAAAAAERLGLDCPVFLYQSQESTALNAMQFHVPGEAHVVLTGPVLKTLDAMELRCLFGHELSHALLWSWDEGSLLVADRILGAMANHPNADDSHRVSHYRFSRYSEIFADRGALLASHDLAAAIRSLVKMHTGLTEVSAEAYVQQAEEILGGTEARLGSPELDEQKEVKSEGLTHPESFIRARALHLWAHDGEASGEDRTNATIERMIEGPLEFATVDLLEQVRLTDLTRRFFDAVLAPRWLQTDAMRACVGLFFVDYSWPAPSAEFPEKIAQELSFDDAKLRDYFLYLLLDLLIADPELDDAPLAWFLQVADQFGGGARLEELVNKELRVSKRVLTRIRKETGHLIAGAAALAAKGG